MEKDHKTTSKMNFIPKTSPLIKHPSVFEGWKPPKYSDRDVGFLFAYLFFKRQIVWVIMAVLFWRRLSLAHTMPALPLLIIPHRAAFLLLANRTRIVCSLPTSFCFACVYFPFSRFVRRMFASSNPETWSRQVSKCLSEVLTAGRPAMPVILVTDSPEKQLHS